MSEEAAFPVVRPGLPDDFIEQWGLSKREYFALRALQGILSNANIFGGNRDAYVADAVVYADKLLSKLEETKP